MRHILLFLLLASAARLLVGIDGWGGGRAADQVALGGIVRADVNAGINPNQFWQAGGKAIMNFSGCNGACAGGAQGYSTGGVQAITASIWAANAVSTYQTDCGSATNCPAVEVLNEPGGSWFWGTGATSQANANAYALLLQAAYDAFHTRYGVNAPKILASYDGGDSSSTTWGQLVWANTVGVNVNNYVDGVTAHPYGGPSNPAASALGNRANVTAAHTATGKPVWVTEVGWPTDCSSGCPTTVNATGDSMQWSQPQQATNIYNFVTWARGTGYVAEIDFYEYWDESGKAIYGVRTSGGTAKPGYTALQEAAASQPCTTCG